MAECRGVLKDIEVSFWSKVRIAPGCWEWTGFITEKGYGGLCRGGKAIRAHRVMAEVAGFKIPSGFVSDHLCRNRKCVNPEHIEFVTNKENTLRGKGPTAINALKTHCIRGHKFTRSNTQLFQGKRQCRKCKKALNRASKLRRFSPAPEAGT